MICKNFKNGFNGLAVICVENGVPYGLPCGENIMLTTGLLGINYTWRFSVICILHVEDFEQI